MSNIQRYDVDVNYQRENWSLEEFESGDLIKYEDHAAIVAQLEADLAEARKDQARLDFITYHGISMRIDQTIEPNTWYMDAIYHTNIDFVDGRTRFKTSREAIDAAIKEQQ